jgi:hypothetical protein
MLHEPEQVNWGLSEIARVVTSPADQGIGIAVEWEGDRRIDVRFADFIITS